MDPFISLFALHSNFVWAKGVQFHSSQIKQGVEGHNFTKKKNYGEVFLQLALNYEVFLQQVSVGYRGKIPMGENA